MAGGIQLLQPDMLQDSMQKDSIDRGMDTTDTPVFKYNNAFWAKNITPAEFPQYTCSFWVPFMSGYGGITVTMPPNETVEKPCFQTECKSGDGMIDRLFALNVAEQDCAGLDQCPKSVDLAEIVDQSEPRTRPLYIHFQFRA